MKIIPAMLVQTPDQLFQQVAKLLPFFQHFQIDIADGEFVPQKTLLLIEVQEAISQLPSPSSITLDFDLIVDDVNAAMIEIDKLGKKIKVGTIFVHNLGATNVRPNLAIAIDPTINVETIKQRFDLNSVPAIQVMSVNPGAQGQAFIPETLKKIGELKKAGYRGEIYLDGGINNQTVPMIIDKPYRPDILCIGSYLTQAENVEERIKQLNALISS